VEEVPITESKDYTEPDVFYDVHKEGFEETTAEGKEVYNFPVSVQLNIPETTTAEITTPTAAVVEEKTTVTVDEVVPTTEIDVAEQTTTTVYNNPVSTSAPATAAATTTQEPLKTTTVFAEPTTTTPSAPLTDGHQVRFVLSTLKEVKLQVTFQGKSACFVNISTFLLKGLSINIFARFACTVSTIILHTDHAGYTHKIKGKVPRPTKCKYWYISNATCLTVLVHHSSPKSTVQPNYYLNNPANVKQINK
jgi:hypothetical protein